MAEDQKLGSALDQTSGIRGLLNMSTGGNETASQAAQVRFAEHEVKEGGINRFNQTEAKCSDEATRHLRATIAGMG